MEPRFVCITSTYKKRNRFWPLALSKLTCIYCLTTYTLPRSKKMRQTKQIRHIQAFNSQTRPRGYKTFFMLNSIEREILNVHTVKYTYRLFLGSDKPRLLFFSLINVKMPTIVGILTFMSKKNFMLIWVEHEKSLITSGPVWLSKTNADNTILSCDPTKPTKLICVLSRDSVQSGHPPGLIRVFTVADLYIQGGIQW